MKYKLSHRIKMKRFSPLFNFSRWKPDLVPPVAAGVYAIWEDNNLVYCGMSGRGFDPSIAATKTKHGLVTRLHSHASGRLSGDQFCVYVANRLVIPKLESSQLAAFASGELTLDQLTRKYIRERLSFQFATTPTSQGAYALEAECRSGKIFGAKPLLNPLNIAT
ncbi:hypothetical protein [Quisquiliibacterium transsilvanicum]|uniref:GIY-YIG domain-containing protein n=1 Tax=Quisquiliibacterium transsilvanicum TaxID=1549638 RepID=A0A7W8HF65_9BURK|nr:hypothetical protein [Quisquiliibacterium transsilvanicum]MBB5270875.1 hypothetical protein [Quisquiliibacterium transsilvanicum]